MNRKTLLFLLCALTLPVCLGFAAESPQHNFQPAAGYVPDEATAIRIALAVWEPIYGRAQIAREKPFHASLARGVWTVEGSLPLRTLGGVALAEISRSDGRILRVSHGK